MNEVNTAQGAQAIDAVVKEACETASTNTKRPYYWKCLDENVIRICWGILRKNSLANHCRTLMHTYLFKSPFEVYKLDGDRIHFTPSFADNFDKHFKQFSKDFMDALFVIGVVPFDLIQKENELFYPHVPPPGTYVIQKTYVAETGKSYYRVWRSKKFSIKHNTEQGDARYFWNSHLQNVAPPLNSARAYSGLGGSFSELLEGDFHMKYKDLSQDWYLDKDIYVFDGFGFDPDVDGTINSPLSALIADVVYANSMADIMNTAERRMVNPMLVLQHHKTENPKNDLDPSVEHNVPVYDSNDTGYQGSVAQENIRKELVALQEQMNYANTMSDAAFSSENRRVYQKLREKVIHMENLIKVPLGLEYVNTSRMESGAGSKYLALLDRLNRTITRVFGFPYSMVDNDSGNLRGVQDSYRDHFRNELGKNAETIGKYITFIVNRIWGNIDNYLESGLTNRKPIVDDTHFADIPRRTCATRTKITVNDSKKPLPFPDPDMQIFKEPVDLSSASDQYSQEDRKKRIHSLMQKNKDYQDTLRGEKGPEGTSIDANDLKENKNALIIILPVATHMDAKHLKHAADIEAIDFERYQECMRAKASLGRTPFKRKSSMIQDLLKEINLTPGSEPPRADTTLPESENLGPSAKKRKVEMTPSPAILTEAARRGIITPEQAKEVALGLAKNEGTKTVLPSQTKAKKKDSKSGKAASAKTSRKSATSTSKKQTPDRNTKASKSKKKDDSGKPKESASSS
jgi:hypothetical protein